jgi:sugar lactone lactonase YvrE
MGRYTWVCIAILIGLGACNSGNGNMAGGTDTAAAAPADTAVADTVQRTLELVYSDSVYQLTGVATAPGGQMLVNYPRWSNIYRYAVVEAGDSAARPYPNDTMNRWRAGQTGANKWVCVQAVYFDDSATLWVVDPAAPFMKKIQGGGAKLVRLNRQTGQVERTYSFTGIVPDTAYVNDVRVDVKKQYAYLSESKGGGIIVVNLKDGGMRRMLSTHPSVKSDTTFKFIIDSQELKKDGKPVKINSDGIALSPDGSWLYYKPLTDDKLYRVRTEFLHDWDMKEADLGKRVEDLGKFATTDGMIFDKDGNLYIGDLQRYRIIKITPDLRMITLVEDPRLIWPDSYSIADGYLYISCSQIQKQPDYNAGVNKRTSPYTVFRVKL